MEKNEYIEQLKKDAVELLVNLIETPSVSGSEDKSADLIYSLLKEKCSNSEAMGLINRLGNNVWCYNRFFNPQKPTILLCSHHDTVEPNDGYTLNPFEAIIKEGKIYGLGSNDAGASLVTYISFFRYYYEKQDMPYNLCLLLSAEEELNGVKGVRIALPEIQKTAQISFAVVGEPTLMDIAIAERGLLVIDCSVEGISGHAAHYNTINPIIKAISDIEWFSSYKFDRISPILGEVKMSVTMISSGIRHNIIPAKCGFIVDIRSNGLYSNAELVDIIRSKVLCDVKPRSLNLNSSSIDENHPFVFSALKNGCVSYGSNTLSDQAHIPFDSVKIGVGDSLRSHTADEFVYVDEIEMGIDKFINIFDTLFKGN